MLRTAAAPGLTLPPRARTRCLHGVRPLLRAHAACARASCLHRSRPYVRDLTAARARPRERPPARPPARASPGPRRTSHRAEAVPRYSRDARASTPPVAATHSRSTAPPQSPPERGWIGDADTNCKLCANALETPGHLCKDCPFAKEVWAYIKQWFNLTALDNINEMVQPDGAG